MKSVPVDYDPFALKSVPVDGDPFAAPAGPAKDVSAFFQKQITPGQAISDSFNEAIEPAQPDRRKPEYGFERSLATSSQGAAKSVASMIGTPIDIGTFILNGLAGGANGLADLAEWVSGKELPRLPRITNPPGGSENIADIFSRMFEALGGHVYDQSEMTPEQRLGYKVNDFAGQAATGGASLIKAGTVKATEMAAPTLGKMVAETIPDYITNAYRQAPARTLAGDVAGGAGSATALEGLERYWPEHIPVGPVDIGSEGSLPRLLAVILGGGAGSAALNTATRSPAATIEAVTDRLPAPKEFQDPDGLSSVSNRSVKQAVDYVHQNASDAKSALGKLMEELNSYYQAGGAMPTTGLMTDDVGLQLLDRSARDRNPKPFMERDQAVRNSAHQDMEALKSEGADKTIPRQVAENEMAVRQSSADARLSNAEQQVARQNESDRALGDVYAYPPMTSEDASIALDKALIGDIGIPMRTQKRENFQSIDPDGTVMRSTDGLMVAVKSVREKAADLPAGLRSEILPENVLQAIEGLAPKITEKTTDTGLVDASGRPVTRTESVNSGGPGEISFKGMNEMRPILAAAEQRARQGGFYPLADSLRAIKNAIGAEGEALAASGGAAGERAAEANRFYQEDYKPFREGVVGNRMKAIAKNPQRDQTPPSETAGKLFPKTGATEAGTNVNAAIARGAPEAQKASRDAIRAYFLSDLRHAVRNGKVDENLLQRWIGNNAPTLAQQPELRKEIDDLLNAVRGRGAKSSALEAELKAAQAGKVQTERDLAKSAFAIFANKSPEKAAAELFGADDPVAAVQRMRKSFGGHKPANEGLKAMVADYLIDQAELSTKAGVSGDVMPLSLARVNSLFKRNERLLKEVYGDDIRYLNMAQRRLEALSRRANQATPGSATVERTGFDRLKAGGLRAFEIVSKIAFGHLQGGGYTRSARLLADGMPDSTAAAQQLVFRMSFDPVLAKHLLSATPKEIAAPKWSRELNRMMGWAEAGRASSGEEE